MDAPRDRRLPYPVDVQRREPDREPPPPAGGVETFDTDLALAINRARMSHLPEQVNGAHREGNRG